MEPWICQTHRALPYPLSLIIHSAISLNGSSERMVWDLSSLANLKCKLEPIFFGGFLFLDAQVKFWIQTRYARILDLKPVIICVNYIPHDSSWNIFPLHIFGLRLIELDRSLRLSILWLVSNTVVNMYRGILLKISLNLKLKLVQSETAELKVMLVLMALVCCLLATFYSLWQVGWVIPGIQCESSLAGALFLKVLSW